MWFIFLVIPTAISAVSSLFSLTGGMQFAVAAVATREWQKNKGYRPGEGRFTERANDKYYGVRFEESTSDDLSHGLWQLSGSVPGLFKPYLESSFDFTVSEGMFLRALLAPALLALGDFEAAKLLVIEQDNEESRELFCEMTDRLASVVIPVVRWLEQFPAARVRKEHD